MWFVNIIIALNTVIFFWKYISYKNDYERSVSRSKSLEYELKSAENKIQDLSRSILQLENELKRSKDKIRDLSRNVTIESGLMKDMDNTNKSKIESLDKTIFDLEKKIEKITQISHERYRKYQEEKEKVESFRHIFESNLSALPYMAAFIADYETYELEALAKQLDWGYSIERSKKVASIRDIRRAAKEMAEKNLESKYQLQYLLELFPNLQDVIETDYKQLPLVKVEELSDYDAARDWLSKEEYQSLSTVERNQLALDRYKESHNKTKWQIGRDYELFVGYKYQQKGYKVDYFGSYMGMEDLGRDLIAKKDGKTLIIQCKYWGHEKVIHEKHITQLYGTMASYIIEQGIPSKNVTGILVTNITLSEQAKKMADYLKIQYVEKFEKGDYPCIKCNIGNDGYGKTYIYHLPFDQQYDSTKIDAPGEFFAMTVKEAEEKGFRRAFKWFGS